jgi:hypothetical protein
MDLQHCPIYMYLLLSSDLVRSPAAERVCLEAIRMGTLRRGPPSSSGSSLVYVFTTASGFLTYIHSMKVRWGTVHQF